MMKKNILPMLSFIAGMIAFAPSANADLLVSPLRVVFEGSTRTATVNLINDSKETRTYRVETAEKQMAEGVGGYKDLDTAPAFSAASYLKFSPTQVTLRPGEAQSVRVALRKPESLADGEYHSHLVFKRLDNSKPDDEGGEQKKGMAIKLYLNLSFAIPVFIRQNVDSADAQAKITKTSFGTGEQPTLDVTVDRKGDVSTYGRIRIYNQDKKQVGMLNNAALFTEINQRTFNVPLEPAALQASELYVAYEGLNEYAGVTFDQKTLKLK